MSSPNKAEDNLAAFRLNREARSRGLTLLVDTDGRLKVYIFPVYKIKQHTEFLLEVSLHHDTVIKWLTALAGRTLPAT